MPRESGCFGGKYRCPKTFLLHAFSITLSSNHLGPLKRTRLQKKLLWTIDTHRWILVLPTSVETVAKLRQRKTVKSPSMPPASIHSYTFLLPWEACHSNTGPAVVCVCCCWWPSTPTSKSEKKQEHHHFLILNKTYHLHSSGVINGYAAVRKPKKNRNKQKNAFSWLSVIVYHLGLQERP